MRRQELVDNLERRLVEMGLGDESKFPQGPTAKDLAGALAAEVRGYVVDDDKLGLIRRLTAKHKYEVPENEGTIDRIMRESWEEEHLELIMQMDERLAMVCQECHAAPPYSCKMDCRTKKLDGKGPPKVDGCHAYRGQDTCRGCGLLIPVTANLQRAGYCCDNCRSFEEEPDFDDIEIQLSMKDGGKSWPLRHTGSCAAVIFQEGREFERGR